MIIRCSSDKIQPVLRQLYDEDIFTFNVGMTPDAGRSLREKSAQGTEPFYICSLYVHQA